MTDVNETMMGWMRESEQYSLASLPPGDELAAWTSTPIPVEIARILTGRDIDIEEELRVRSLWRRASAAASWECTSKHLTLAGEDEPPLCRLTEGFEVVLPREVRTEAP